MTTRIAVARAHAMTAVDTPIAFDPTRDVYPTGPRRLLVFGPPGTGKSTAIAGLVLPALANGSGGVVLACAFTCEAALTLRERLAVASNREPKDFERVGSTIHSTSLRLLRANGMKAKIWTRDTEGAEYSPEDRLRSGTLDVGSVAERSLRVWERARNGCISEIQSREFAALVAAIAPDLSVGEVRREITKYEEEKQARGRIDFADMILLALHLKPPIFELLVVDEAQDCSPAMWALVEHWARASRFVVLVGDPDQTVHGWAGADPAKLLTCVERGYEARRLVQSYRVPAAPHALARHVIRRNRSRVDVPFEPAPRAGLVAERLKVAALRAIDEAAAGKRSVFVLARSARILASWSRDIEARCVPFVSKSGYAPLGSPNAVAAARAVVAIRAGCAVDVVDVCGLLAGLPKVGCACLPVRKRDEVIKSLTRFPGSLTLEDLEGLGVRLAPFRLGNLEDGFRTARLGARAKSLSKLVDRHGEDVLTNTPPVTASTMHASKGREADLVVVDMEAPRLVVKSIRRRDPDAIESERRVIYVALTRARDTVLIVRHPKRDLLSAIEVPSIVMPRGAKGGGS